jgi:GTPase SAR1 family protein
LEQQPQSGDLKSALSNCVAMLRSLIVKMATIIPTGTPQAENWYSILENLQKKLDENRCRMAVVGTVKSGKSTLVNSLLGADLLKRGAGIVTAMITRIEPGDRAGAVLSFKDWEEVNGELNSALSLFPSPVLLERQEGYDIRQEEDRQLLREALAQADQAQLLHLDMLDKNYILIKSFLEGYAEVRKIIDTGSQRLQLNEGELATHQQMVGREAEAVYLKDVRLTLPFPWPARGLQLGDCQGSDSPIPQHLAQVQNYLIGADLVVYVVSSRIGLRQADYKFLTDLKRMRLWENCVFILNLDLNELANLVEAQSLAERWQRELAVFQTEAPFFTFSGLDLLLHRLKEQGQTLSPKDQGMLDIWEADAPLTEFSRREAARFEEYLQKVLTTRQTRLLLSSSLGQLQTVSQGLKERILLQDKFLNEDVAAFETIRDRLARRRQPLESLLHSLGQALQGAVYDLKHQVRPRLDTFFDPKHGEVGPEISKFIQEYQVDLNKLEIGEQLNAFMPGLYQVYQGFQQRLLLFLTEEINLKILEFIQSQEKWQQDELSKVLEPLLAPLQDALNLYYQEIEKLGIKAPVPVIKPVPWTKPEEMQPKLFSLDLGLNLRLRSQAMLVFGINLIKDAVGKLKKLWRKEETAKQSERLKTSLADALTHIKGHTQEEMFDNLLSYREGLKFQYYFPLLEYLAKEQETGLKSALTALLVDLEGVQEAISQKSHQKEVWRRQIADLAVQVERFEKDCLELETAYPPASTR